MKSLILTISVLLNIALAGLLFFKVVDGCAEISDGKLGVLARDVQAGVLGTDRTVLTLPKGLVVRDASATGASRFEPHRFKIIVTSEDRGIVNYSDAAAKQANQHGELYSADVARSGEAGAR